MRAMVLDRPGSPLRLRELAPPSPGVAEVRLEVSCCGVCRTDLHVVDGELPDPLLPLVPGHQAIGRVVELGPGATGLELGQRVGVPWLGGTCGSCRACRAGQENLCDEAIFTGYQRHGGFATEMVARARFCFPVPEGFADLQAAPLLCAGLIGHRALRMAGEAKTLGLYGFGAAAHIVAQVARWRGQRIFAFTRDGDRASRAFARALGAEWVGGEADLPPEPLDAALLFAPVGAHVPVALAAVRKGGSVICAGIHMSDIPAFPYQLLWGERVVRSVANLTRQDGEELLALAPRIPIETAVTVFPLAEANAALAALRAGAVQGAIVLEVAGE